MTGFGTNLIAIASEKRLFFFVSELHQWNSTVVVRDSAVDDDRNETMHSFGTDRSYHLMSTSLPPENVGQDVSSLTMKSSPTNENVSRNYQQTTFNSYTVC